MPPVLAVISVTTAPASCVSWLERTQLHRASPSMSGATRLSAGRRDGHGRGERLSGAGPAGPERPRQKRPRRSPVGRAITAMLASVVTAAKIRPMTVTGATSPYPTVVSVMTPSPQGSASTLPNCSGCASCSATNRKTDADQHDQRERHAHQQLVAALSDGGCQLQARERQPTKPTEHQSRHIRTRRSTNRSVALMATQMSTRPPDQRAL